LIFYILSWQQNTGHRLQENGNAQRCQTGKLWSRLAKFAALLQLSCLSLQGRPPGLILSDKYTSPATAEHLISTRLYESTTKAVTKRQHRSVRGSNKSQEDGGIQSTYGPTQTSSPLHSPTWGVPQLALARPPSISPAQSGHVRMLGAALGREQALTRLPCTGCTSALSLARSTSSFSPTQESSERRPAALHSEGA
jgi:hypothetical protein